MCRPNSDQSSDADLIEALDFALKLAEAHNSKLTVSILRMALLNEAEREIEFAKKLQDRGDNLTTTPNVLS